MKATFELSPEEVDKAIRRFVAVTKGMKGLDIARSGFGEGISIQYAQSPEGVSAVLVADVPIFIEKVDPANPDNFKS